MPNLSELHYNEFMDALLASIREITGTKIDEIDARFRVQEINEKYLTFLITIVLEDNHMDLVISDEIIDLIKSGVLNYSNVNEYAPSEPLYQSDIQSLASKIRKN